MKSKFYYSDGTISSERDYSKVVHRENGPAVEYSDGTKSWYINGKYHREDGPAVELSSGTKFWHINGRRHREDGPACEFNDGSVLYYLNNLFYFKKDFDKEIRKMKKANKDKHYYFDGTISSKRDFDKILHRENGPAVERSNGAKAWFINGKHHREDGPASEYSNGDKNWYINGKLHREDGPAVEYNTGSVYYWLNDKCYSKKDFDKEIRKMKKANKVKNPKEDKYYYSDGAISSELDIERILHREDGPAVENSDGTKEWYINDKLHREDGPAIEFNSGTKHWLINGKYHREDGPAIEYSDGSVEYWLNSKFYSEKEFNELISKINKKETTMKEKAMKEKAIQNFKNDSKKAIVRSGANKLTKTAKSAIVMASSKLSSEQAELVQKMVSSEKGEAGLRLALGYLLTYLPLGSLADNPKVQLMAEEFRISGQTIVQDEVIEKLSSIFIPMIQSVAESMPEIEVNVTKKQPKTKTRVVKIKQKESEIEEQDEIENLSNVICMKTSK